MPTTNIYIYIYIYNTYKMLKGNTVKRAFFTEQNLIQNIFFIFFYFKWSKMHEI